MTIVVPWLNRGKKDHSNFSAKDKKMVERRENKIKTLEEEINKLKQEIINIEKKYE